MKPRLVKRSAAVALLGVVASVLAAGAPQAQGTRPGGCAAPVHAPETVMGIWTNARDCGIGAPMIVFTREFILISEDYPLPTRIRRDLVTYEGRPEGVIVRKTPEAVAAGERDVLVRRQGNRLVFVAVIQPDGRIEPVQPGARDAVMMSCQ